MTIKTPREIKHTEPLETSSIDGSPHGLLDTVSDEEVYRKSTEFVRALLPRFTGKDTLVPCSALEFETEDVRMLTIVLYEPGKDMTTELTLRIEYCGQDDIIAENFMRGYDVSIIDQEGFEGILEARFYSGKHPPLSDDPADPLSLRVFDAEDESKKGQLTAIFFDSGVFPELSGATRTDRFVIRAWLPGDEENPAEDLINPDTINLMIAWTQDAERLYPDDYAREPNILGNVAIDAAE